MGKVSSVDHCSVVFVKKEKDDFKLKENILEEARVFCCRLLWLYRPTPSSVSFHRQAVPATRTRKINREVNRRCCNVGGGGGEPNKTRAKTWASSNIFSLRVPFKDPREDYFENKFLVLLFVIKINISTTMP